MIKVYADGSLTATCIVPEGSDPGVLPFEGHTTNEAEYAALLQALFWIEKQNPGQFEILMDSQLVVFQVNGQYKTHNRLIGWLALARIELVWCSKSGYNVTLKWIPREENLAGLVLG